MKRIKKIDDLLEKTLDNYLEKHHDKWLELGTYEMCMIWFKKRFMFAVFLFLMFLSVFCIELSVKNVICEIVFSALFSYVFCMIFFFIMDKGDTK